MNRIHEVLELKKVLQLKTDDFIQVLIDKAMTLLVKCTPHLLALGLKLRLLQSHSRFERVPILLILILLGSLSLPQIGLDCFQKEDAQLREMEHVLYVQIRNDVALYYLLLQQFQLKGISVDEYVRC